MFEQVNDWNAVLKSCIEDNRAVDAEKLCTRICLVFERFSLQSPDQIREWYKRAKGSIAPAALSSSAILFIQWAEFEMTTGRMTKALSILQMALELEALPNKTSR